MTSIVPLTLDHCVDVAQLHLNYLSSPFTGQSGRRLLSLYYASVTETGGACGYVAEKKGQLLGYVCGVWDSALVRATLLKKYRFRLAWAGLEQVIINPAIVVATLARLARSKHSSDHHRPAYELRPIVVTPEARGTGVAAELVTHLTADARRRNFQQMGLFTEVTNTAANAFYQKNGFQPVEIVQRSGMAYQYYERVVSEVL